MRLGKVRYESKYLTIQFLHAKKGWSIRWMCRHLGISKAAYYKWLHRPVPQAEQENLMLAELIREYDEKHSLKKDHVYLIDTPFFPAELRKLAEETARELGFQAITWMKTGCVITCHGGPGAFGIVGFNH